MILISPDQIRAGRALLKWSAEQLAKEAKLGVATVRRAEGESTLSITAANKAAIKSALEAGGVLFIERNGQGEGVRLKRPAGDGA